MKEPTRTERLAADRKGTGYGAPIPGERGRPEPLTGDPEGFAYGEPKGPKPPHIERLPKEEIERRAASGEADRSADPSRLADERARGNFHSGMTTPETFETTGDEHPKVVRRTDPVADALPRDAGADAEHPSGDGDRRPPGPGTDRA